MYRGGQLRDISEVSEAGVKTIQQFRHLGPITHPLNSSPSVDHGQIIYSPGSFLTLFRSVKCLILKQTSILNVLVRGKLYSVSCTLSCQFLLDLLTKFYVLS